jgi:hypothetical protein
MYVHEILSNAHIFSTSFSPDTSLMCFAEGERSFGLRFLADVMDHCPEQFIQMMREVNARAELDTADSALTDDDLYPDAEPDPIRHPVGSDIYGTN